MTGVVVTTSILLTVLLPSLFVGVSLDSVDRLPRPLGSRHPISQRLDGRVTRAAPLAATTVFCAGFFASGADVLAVSALVVAAAATSRFVEDARRHRRGRRFDVDLSETLEEVSRHLSAGTGLHEALREASVTDSTCGSSSLRSKRVRH